jgi:Transglutaminase-like superfamily
MLSLSWLRHPSDDDLGHIDLAVVDLTCAAGLRGSESLDTRKCLAWLDHAAAWTHHQTQATFDQFTQDPGAYDHSEGIFRMVAMVNVLWRGMGVRYNQERIENVADAADSRDLFIHGIIEGHGGTCASLPVLVACVGRRLGYPLKLVITASHQFCRWEDPAGERFNIEINNTGLNSYPDEHYLTWPVDIRGTNWRQETHFLRSFSPREEVARVWTRRGDCLHANGWLCEAVDCYAVACSLVSDDRLLDRCLWHLMGEWRTVLTRRFPSGHPRFKIDHATARRYPGLPWEIEREILVLTAIEQASHEPALNMDLLGHCVLA